MTCDLCNRTMKEIARSARDIYYKCPRCHYYSTESINSTGQFDYNEYDTFDCNQENRNNLLIQAARMLQYKFNLINKGELPQSFLDIGCSEGVFVEAYNNIVNENRAYGIEVSKNKIERCRDGGLKVYSFADMPDIEFEFVLLRHVIEHIDSPIEYLQSIKKYIKKGGIICIETPHNENFDNTRNGNQLREDRFLRDLYPPTHICGFTPKAIRVCAQKVGLTPIKIITHDAGSPNWYYTDEERKLSLWRCLLEKINMGTNVVAFLQK